MSQNTDMTDRIKSRSTEVLWLEKCFEFATDSLFCEGNNWNNNEAVMSKAY